MSYLLETLGRGWIGRLADAFTDRLRRDDTRSRNTLQDMVRSEPDRADLRLELGFVCLKEDRISQAREAFEAAIRLDSHNALTHMARACCLEELGLIADAAKALNAAADLEPEDAAVQFGLGYCHERRGRLGEAITHYRCALHYCPTLRNAHERLAAIYIHQGDLASAIEQHEEMLTLEPDDVGLYIALGNLRLNNNDAGDAINCFENALLLEPDNDEAREDLAKTLEKAGFIREAIEQLHTTAERRPDYAGNHLRLGDLYARIGNDEASIASYLKAVEIDPGLLEATVKIGTQHLRAGRYGDAAGYFGKELSHAVSSAG